MHWVRSLKTNMCYYTYLETRLFQGEMKGGDSAGAKQATVGKNTPQSATFLEFQK